MVVDCIAEDLNGIPGNLARRVVLGLSFAPSDLYIVPDESVQSRERVPSGFAQLLQAQHAATPCARHGKRMVRVRVRLRESLRGLPQNPPRRVADPGQVLRTQ